MEHKISPKYQMDLTLRVKERLFELYSSYDNVESYILKWHEVIINPFPPHDENFSICHQNNGKFDTMRTLQSIDGETLLKIAIDLGIETPGFIPLIPTFRNDLKSDFSVASQTFEKAFKQVESDPSLAIGLANSALESIIKKILSDYRILIDYDERDTLSKLISKICKAFNLHVDKNMPKEVKTIGSSLISVCNAIEDLRSKKTEFHGKANKDLVVTSPLYSYLIVNAVSTVGSFLLNFYKANYPPYPETPSMPLPPPAPTSSSEMPMPF